ncbi:MAG: SLC13 family permease, partial [Deltaproteobacteria bacterium]|nr:SLC13 family permease [Deltaproteobacteria bacterium]
AIFFWKAIDFRLTYIALLAALPIIAFSPKRLKILRNIDWHTLIFFAAMFVLMESVWESGFIQSAMNGFGTGMSSVSVTLIISVLVSQLLSNVPFVALYLPLLKHIDAGSGSLMALAAGSTIAGNLLILGAASNIIVIQNAEKRGHTLTFLEFASVGAPLTILNVLVYWVWLMMIG